MGEPYMPSNCTEGDDFETKWCSHCLADKDFRQQLKDTGDPRVDGCRILASVAGTTSQPKEWQYQHGMPWCTAFEEDPGNPARCLFTEELPL